MGRVRKGQKVEAVFDEQRRHVAGIDLAGHADHYVCGPRRDDGEPNIRHFGTTTGELEKMSAWLRQEGVISVAMESTSVYWIPVCDLLESGGIEVVLVDTREVRMTPGRKSDVRDCQWLQKLHSCGLLRGAFRPPENICAIRTLIREKASLVSDRATWVHRMQKSCDQMNVRIHHSELGAFFRNVARRQDAKTAIKATARRMATLIYRLVKFGKAFVDKGAELYEAQFRAKKVKSLGRLVKSLSLNESELKTVMGQT
jgi:hypothetical protein